MDEALYYDQRAMVQKLSNALMAADPGDSDDVSDFKPLACRTLKFRNIFDLNPENVYNLIL